MSSTTHGATPYYFVPGPSRHPVMAAIGEKRGRSLGYTGWPSFRCGPGERLAFWPAAFWPTSAAAAC